MHIVNNILRFVAHKFGLFLLANSLLIGIPLLAISSHITNRETVKGWLVTANTYELLIDESLNLIQRESNNEDGGESKTKTLGESLNGNQNLNQDALITAMKTVFTPDFIRGEAEVAIDGTYDWLEGLTDKPEFTVSFAQKQQELAIVMGDELEKQLETMPACTPEEVTPNFDPFESGCLPEGLDIEQEVGRFVNDFAGPEGFLSDAVWTGDDIDLSDQNARRGQLAFKSLSSSGLFVLVGLIFGVVLITFTSKRGKMHGLKDVGHTLIGSSVLMFIFAFIVSRMESLPGSVIESGDGASESTAAAAKTLIEPLATTISRNISSSIALMSGFAVASGAVLIMTTWYVRRQRKHASKDNPKTKDEPKVTETIDLKETEPSGEDANSLLDALEDKPKKPKAN